jgi:hypothetical protein
MDKTLVLLAAAVAVLLMVSLALSDPTNFIRNTLEGVGSEDLNESSKCIGDAARSGSNPDDCVSELEETIPNNPEVGPGG